MTLQEVKENIYDHIDREYQMGLPPHESWEGITEGEEWVDESIQSGFTLEDIQGKIFDEVYEKWSNENEEDDPNDEEDE